MPTAKEKQLLDELYNEQLQLFEQKKLDPAVILKIGEYPLDQQVDQAYLFVILVQQLVFHT